MKRFSLAALMVTIGIGLSGCISDAPYRPIEPIHTTPARGIEGRWVDPNGITSSFHNGVFETRSADTNEKLSEGNYVSRSPTLIEIEMRSLVRGTVSRVNCAHANPTRLLCTSQDGGRFTLTRQS